MNFALGRADDRTVKPRAGGRCRLTRCRPCGAGKLVSDLTGADGARIWHDAVRRRAASQGHRGIRRRDQSPGGGQALYKRPWANPTSLHADNPRWSFTSTQAISLWVALDDTDVRNGCLTYLPGTP